jgi:phenylpropionate dioxygenase-like ring-hydroxylating dioxygenase large terminal subunit
MFINFWYPAEESDAITREPRKVTMLGMHFVMWRDETGKHRCVSGG